MKQNKIPITLVLEKGINSNMILSSISTMVGVNSIELHRKKKKWSKGYVVEEKNKT